MRSPEVDHAPARTNAFRLGYRPQLDGMRAVAILGVMAFHASIFDGAQGGYLGVEVFFVLSGFLITTLLTQEREATGRIRLSAFYARRALRLLPALGVFLATAAVYALVRPHAIEVQHFWRDFVAAIAYVANWSIALQSYFQTRLLSHTWTLGMEEQFYLLWPVALLFLLSRRRGRDLALAVAAGGAVAVTAWRSYLYVRGGSLPHVSFGFDTRASGLLLGAALGLAATSGRLRVPVVVARVASIVGMFAVLLVLVSHRYGLAAISLAPGREYVEGILVADLASALLLVGLVFDDQGPVSLGFATRPMVWIGKVSYGLYLWHPFVDLAVTPDRTGLTPWLNQVVRVALTVAVVTASYYVVELPALRRKRRFERRPDLDQPAELVDAPVPGAVVS